MEKESGFSCGVDTREQWQQHCAFHKARLRRSETRAVDQLPGRDASTEVQHPRMRVGAISGQMLFPYAKDIKSQNYRSRFECGHTRRAERDCQATANGSRMDLHALDAIGVQSVAIKATQQLYVKSRHWIRAKAQVHPSVVVSSGGRQGCRTCCCGRSASVCSLTAKNNNCDTFLTYF